MGTVRLSTLSSDTVESLSSLARSCGHIIDVNEAQFQKFFRLQIGSELYFSEEYQRVKKRNSFTVLYSNEDGGLECGQIQYFLYVFKLVAVVKILKPCVGSFVDPTTFGLKIPIIPVEADTFAVIFVSNILNKCVYIDLGGTKYVALFPSKIVGD